MKERMRTALRVVLLGCLLPLAADAGPVRVVATNSDLGDLVTRVGGDRVEVEVLARGPQDAHFVEPRPSFVRALHRADLLVSVGMGLESGWLPTLLRSARNPDVVPGGAGSVDASTAIAPLQVPSGGVDRSMGDVHALGNPHYLTDPLNGLRVAALLRDRLGGIDPEHAGTYAARYGDFARALMVALVGAEAAAARTPEELAREIESGGADAAPGAGGWLRRARAMPGLVAVQDHQLWPYFARRFGLRLLETLEPKPGIAPTTRHLSQVVARMQAQGASLILASPYFDTRHAGFVAEHSGARIARMAHQVGAREGTDDYLATVAHNVEAVFGP